MRETRDFVIVRGAEQQNHFSLTEQKIMLKQFCRTLHLLIEALCCIAHFGFNNIFMHVIRVAHLFAPNQRIQNEPYILCAYILLRQQVQLTHVRCLKIEALQNMRPPIAASSAFK
jgi:hypothetical protein